MADITSSVIVLGNARARDLPEIPGRAIWQHGLKMIEVQTPLLDPKDAEEILKPFKVAAKADTNDSVEKAADGAIEKGGLDLGQSFFS